MIAFTMGRIKYRPAVPILVQLLDDAEIAAQAVSALGKMRAHEARAPIEILARSSTGLAKREAVKALTRLGVEKAEVAT
jgi:HEAT repeat protein